MRLINCTCAWCSIVPPYLFDEIAERSPDPNMRKYVEDTRRADAAFRATRAAFLGETMMAGLAAVDDQPLRRTVYDARNSNDLARKRVVEEGGKLPADKAVREAYQGAGKTWKFFKDVFDRSSVDNAGLSLVSTVHYRRNYNNAIWNGQQMAYGDGDGVIFNRFTASLDIIAHELAHAVTQYTAGLVYENQPGALNEHFSDVFGILVKHWSRGQKNPAKANWIIGEGLFRPGIKGMGLRSMSDPGSAYDDKASGLGKDPQPKHMDDFVKLPNTEEGDWGGVHYNSGIPNKAFYEAAVAIGAPSWEIVGKIWYVTLTERLRADADFAKCAKETISVARDYFGNEVGEKVAAAWVAVGVVKAGTGPMASFPSGALTRIERKGKSAKRSRSRAAGAQAGRKRRKAKR
jgi:Zn-dependent metalloprotease